MKKTVIKRRKRVPAAGAAAPSTPSPSQPNGRLAMTDQAAAEALVRIGGGSGSGAGNAGGGADESDLDHDDSVNAGQSQGQATRKRKRAAPRKVASSANLQSSGTMEDVEMGLADERDRDRGRDRGRTATLGREMSRESSVKRPRSSAAAWPGSNEEGAEGRWSERASPSYHAQQHHHGHPQHPHTSSHSHSHAHHGGFDLPPLNAALSGGDHPHSHSPFNVGPGGATGNGSSVNVNYTPVGSRTHSPGNAVGGHSAYTLPPPLPAHQHHHSSSSQHHSHHQLYSPPTSTAGHDVSSGPNASIPGSGGSAGTGLTVAELERHYFELHEQRRKMEEMLGRTERMMGVVRRGLEELRAASSTSSSATGAGMAAMGMGMSGAGGASVPINVSGRGQRDSVWPVSNAVDSGRD